MLSQSIMATVLVRAGQLLCRTHRISRRTLSSERSPTIVAIDGLSATGKSTVARALAHRLNFTYFDTGAMYRALTHQALAHKIDVESLATTSTDDSNSRSFASLLDRFEFRIETDPATQERRYLADGVDVSEAIRSRVVTNAVSKVSALPQVRQKLKAFQRSFGATTDCVFEGRDIGTVVFPNARFKFFLSARADVRAARRLREMQAKGTSNTATLQEIQRELEQRDHLDSTRKVAPLACAADAIVVDTSDKTIDEVVSEMADRVLGSSSASSDRNRASFKGSSGT